MDEEESAIGKNGMMHGRSRGDFRVLGRSESVARTSTRFDQQRPFLLRLSDSIVMTLGAVASRGQADPSCSSSTELSTSSWSRLSGLEQWKQGEKLSEGGEKKGSTALNNKYNI